MFVPPPLGALPGVFFSKCCFSRASRAGTSEGVAEDKPDKHALKKGTVDLTTGWKAPHKHKKWVYFIYWALIT